MGRLVRSRLKMGSYLKRDSYFLLVSFTSLILYAICLYTFLNVNGYIGAKDTKDAQDQQHLLQQDAKYARAHDQFDDGKIHEFQVNLARPVDWDMRVKGISFF